MLQPQQFMQFPKAKVSSLLCKKICVDGLVCLCVLT